MQTVYLDYGFAGGVVVVDELLPGTVVLGPLPVFVLALLDELLLGALALLDVGQVGPLGFLAW